MPSNQTYTKRIQKDIEEFYKDNPEGLHIIPREEDISLVHALIHGPDDTPYQKGFFYFVVRFPNQYPLKPPNVKLITTGSNKVRFNPNLYSNGKVCLSILGTWQGPSWSPAQTLLTTLLSIRSLMNEKPYHNEPGHEENKGEESAKVKKDVKNYNEMITHETIRVAVIAMVEEKNGDALNMPQQLKDVMIESFKNNFKFYEDMIRSKLNLDGQPIIDPFKDEQRPTHFQYKKLLDKLLDLKSIHQIPDSSDSKTLSVDSYKQIVDRTLKTEEKKKAIENPDDWSDVFIDENDEPVDLTYSSDDDDLKVVKEKKDKNSM